MKIVKSAAAGTLESSDVLVSVAPGEDLEIEVESVVIKQFGPAIRQAAEEVLKQQGVTCAQVHIQDRGALECTIRARVETALLRAGEVE